MKRRDALKAMAGLAASATWAGVSNAQQGPTEDTSLPELMKTLLPRMGKVPIQASKLPSGLSLFTGPGGNVAVLTGPDGLVVVDAFVPEGGAALVEAVRKLGTGPITLINTHWHFDHAGGNAAFGGAGAKIVAHENARKRLSTEQFMADYELKVPASPLAALPTETIGDEATLKLNGEEIRLVHVAPAHTDGDVFLHFPKANVLHTGDLFTNGSYPNIDNSSEGWIGGMVAAADRMLKVADDKTAIIPGHGPMASRDDLKAFREMLSDVRARIEPMVAIGQKVDEIVAAKPLASLDARWAKGLFKGTHFTRLVYGGLIKQRYKS